MKPKNYFLLPVLIGCINLQAQSDTFLSKTCLGSLNEADTYYNGTVADFDGDGDLDIIVHNFSNTYILHTNDGTNNFTSSNITPNLVGPVKAMDVEGDGDIDLVNNNGKIYLNNGSAVFTEFPTSYFTASGGCDYFLIEDFNGDNKKDLLFLNNNYNSSDKNQLWINNSTPTSVSFTLGSEFPNTNINTNGGSATGDIDGDGDIDLVIAGSAEPGNVMKNDGNGNFTFSQSIGNPSYLNYSGDGILVDFDHDGDLDFLSFEGYNGVGIRLWKNDGSGSFGNRSENLLDQSLPELGIKAWVDLNGDSNIDCIASTGIGSAKKARYYINTGCEFKLQSQTLSNAWAGTVVADFNNDGKKDIFNLGRSDFSCLYLNDFAPKTHVPIVAPTVNTPINYALNATANPLTASGLNLQWYTTATGGTSSSTAPTPSTSTEGTTSYWVTSTNAVGCESDRIEIVVNVLQQATHLNFDGVNDVIVVPNSSTFAFGTGDVTIEAMVKTSFSQAQWAGIVSKMGANPSIKGLQLQIADNKLTFQLSSGLTIYSNSGTTALNDNNWHHVAAVLDRNNNNVKLYVDGVVEADVTNTLFGTLDVSSTADLFIGRERNSNDHFKGNIDEVRVWNVVRTKQQISGSTNCELQGNETGLVAYYKFNQGSDAGNNSTVTTASDGTSNGNNGTLNGFALNGNTSNWLTGSNVITGSTIPTAPTANDQSFCSSNNPTGADLVPSISSTIKWYDASGNTVSSTDALNTQTYYAVAVNANGCESDQTPVSISTSPNNTITETSTGVLSSNETNATSYQWYSCPNTMIPGATGQTFTPTTTGDYKVVVTKGSCSATSSCYTLGTLGIKEQTVAQNKVEVYPNPSNGIFFINTKEDIKISVSDLSGRLILQNALNGSEKSIDLSGAQSGVYLLVVEFESGKTESFKLIKK